MNRDPSGASRATAAVTVLVCALVAAARLPARADSTATVLSNEVLTGGPASVVVRVAFEVSGPGNTWYAPYVRVYLSKDTPLRTADGKELLASWSDVFTPGEPTTVRYTDVRAELKYAALESAVNLPKGGRTTLWAAGDVWEPGQRKWVSGGFGAAAPLIVTTDPAGKVRSVEPFNTRPTRLYPVQTGKTEPGVAVDLTGAHLKLIPAARCVQTKGLRGETLTWLATSELMTEVTDESRGWFFVGPIDTPGKAAELVKIAWPRGAVIKTAAQYKAIVDQLAKIRDFDANRFVKVTDPVPGFTVTPEPGLGFRVSALVLHYNDYQNLRYRSVVRHEVTVGADGRMADVETVCLLAPQTPYGAPPMWEPEYGKPTGPSAGSAPAAPTLPPPGRGAAPAPVNLESAINAYNAAVTAALTLDGHEIIAPLFKVTDRPAEAPVRAGYEKTYVPRD